MYVINIIDAEKITVQDTGEHLLSVYFEIVNPETQEVACRARNGFPLDTTPDQLESALAGVLAAFLKDTETQEATAEFAAQDAQADATISAIVGKQITS